MKMPLSIRSEVPKENLAPVYPNREKITSQELLISNLQRENLLLSQAVTKAISHEEVAKIKLQKFASKVTHDLKAPLRHINAYLNIIKEDCQKGKLNNETISHMETVTSASKKISDMIDGIRLMTKMSEQECKKEEVCLQREFGLVAAQINERYPGITWEVSELPTVETDLVMIKVIFSHLLDNAGKFSQEKEKPRIRISAHKEEEFHIIDIEDNGMGFDPRNKFKLFEMFEKLHIDSTIPGTGVGLAIVEGLLDKLGGKIEGDGEQGRGATFTIKLPV